MADGPALLTAAVGGERRALARLLTGIENQDPAFRELLPRIFAATRGAHLVGVTGPPGAGKSTLVTALTREYRTRGRRVGIVAVDPSSPYTGGAIMGDRIRMMEHAADREVFMRSMASRGELGGIAATSWLVAAALDAAGYDPVVVETVGAGQAELEVADVVVVNKADRPGAERSARQLRAMLAGAGGRFAAPPPILLTVATTGEGIGALVDAIEADRERARSADRALARARNQLLRAVAERSRRRAEARAEWEATVAEIAEHRLDPITAADRLLGK